MAGSLIDSLAEPVFEPGKYQDSYREALDALIQAKINGNDTSTPAVPGGKAEVVDLMAALQASVTAAKKTRPAAAKAPARRPRKASAAKDAEDGGTTTASNVTKKPPTPRTRRSSKSA